MWGKTRDWFSSQVKRANIIYISKHLISPWTCMSHNNSWLEGVILVYSGLKWCLYFWSSKCGMGNSFFFPQIWTKTASGLILLIYLFFAFWFCQEGSERKANYKNSKAAFTDHIAGPVDLLLVCVNSHFDLWSRNLFFRRAVFRKPCEKVEDILWKE